VDGQSGSAGKVLKNGQPQFPKGKVVLKTGDRLEVETPGGGGWGRTSERSGELVELDLAEGLITPEAAREIYRHTRATPAAAE
jgi:N-methylhydantoinase B